MSDLALIDTSNGSAKGSARPWRPAVASLERLWQQPAVRRALPLLSLVGAGTALLLGWAALTAAPQRELVAGSDDADKAAVATALDAAKLPYVIDPGTGAVRVSADDYYKARMLLAAKGLPKSGATETGALGDAPMGSSEAVERRHLQAAQEADLARAIESIDVIAAARVHLAEEAPSLFVRDRKPATASVVLTMRGANSLSEAQTGAITNLVAASVPGLSPDAVAIIDQSGHLLTTPPGLSGAVSAQFAIQKQVEERYRQAIESVLTPLAGPDGFSAQVHVDMDWSNTDATRETYPEASRALRSEDQKWSAEATTAAVGIPGTLSNTVPPATTVSTTPAPPATSPPPTGVTSQDVSRRFELGREVSVTRGSVGSVKRLSLAVALRETGGKRKTPAELSAIEAMVRGAVGADPARGDLVAITARPFVDLAVPPVGLLQQSWVPLAVKYGTLVIGLALAWLLLGRRLLARYDAATKAMREAEIGGLLKAELSRSPSAGASSGPGAVTLEMIEAAPSYADRAELVRTYVRQDPSRAARLFQGLLRAEPSEAAL